jgi:hypothetical protein
MRGQVGIGGLDLSGTKAVQEIVGRAAVGIAGVNRNNVIEAAHAAVDIAGNACYTRNSGFRQAVQRIAMPNAPAVYALSWVYAVTTGVQEPMRWRRSSVRGPDGRPLRGDDGRVLTRPNFELIYGPGHRQLPVVMDSCFAQTHIQRTMPLHRRTLENTIRAAEIIQPDMLFNHDEPNDPPACRRNFSALRGRFGDRVIPIVQVPAYWQSGLSIRANARAIVKSDEWRFYESLAGPAGIIALGGLVQFSPLPRSKRGEFAWWVCHYTGFERFIWLLGQASNVVLNSLGQYIVPAGPFKGDRLLRLVYSDSSGWILEATLDRFSVVHDHPGGQLLHTIQLRENTRHFFQISDCMAAILRSWIAAYRGDIVFPVSAANLPDERDPDSIAQLRFDMFGGDLPDVASPKLFVRDEGSPWLVQGVVAEDGD